MLSKHYNIVQTITCLSLVHHIIETSPSFQLKMKFLILIATILLTFANVCQQTSGYGLTVIDTLSDGKQANYVFESYLLFSKPKFKQLKGVAFDVHLQQSTSFPDDPNTFVLTLEDVAFYGTNSDDLTEYETDLSAATLPIIVTLAETTLDVKEILASPADTNRSLEWKLDALFLITKNLTVQLGPLIDGRYEFNSIGGEIQQRVTPIGQICRMDFSAKRSDEQVSVKYTTRKDHCLGKPGKILIEHFKEYNITDLAKNSELRYGFTFYSGSHQLKNSYVEVNAYRRGDPTVYVREKMTIEFKGLTKLDADNEIDESGLDVVYKELREPEPTSIYAGDL